MPVKIPGIINNRGGGMVLKALQKLFTKTP
jgi:hypothetical protein